MMHKEIEVYVDDMIAKSRTSRDNLVDLRKLFMCFIKYRLRLTLTSASLELVQRNCLASFNQRGIEVDLTKVQAIRDMPTPQTEKHICSFLGKVNYISHFIVQLTTICDPLFKLLKKDTKIEWTDECQMAFDKIK